MSSGTIKGLIVEIGGDTSGLQKALSEINTKSASLSRELKQINSSLKFDPTNTTLLTQKQEVLSESIETTKKRLEELKEIQAKADEAIANGAEISSSNYRTIQREIEKTQLKLTDMINESSNLTKIGNSFQEIGEEIEKTGEKVDSFGTSLTKKVTTVGTAIATAGIVTNASIEKSTTAFETFLGSAEEAEKAIANIREDASKTSFDSSSLIQANQMLIATGESAEDARSMINALGEAVIATGGGNDELVRMSQNLQQIKNAGEATAIDIKQFAYAGIDIYGLLADYTGKTVSEVKDMTISYEDLQGAFQKATSEGGKYYGATEKQSETLAGQVSQLKAETSEMVAELTENLMPIAKKVVSKAKEIIEKFDDLSDSQKNTITKIGLLVTAAGPAIKIAGTAITAIGKVTKSVGTLTKALSLYKNGVGTAEGASADLAKTLKNMTSPAGLVAIGITAITAAYAAYKTSVENATAETREAAEASEEALQTQLEQSQAIKETKAALDESLSSELANLENTKTLKEELSQIVDENGKVKEGYENRAQVILNQLNEALGTEYKMNGNIIEQYQQLQDEIDELVLKKQAEATMETLQTKYNTALEDSSQLSQELIDKQEALKNKKQELYDAEKAVQDKMNEFTLFKRNSLY